MKQIQDNDALIYLAFVAEAIMFIVGLFSFNRPVLAISLIIISFAGAVCCLVVISKRKAARKKREQDYINLKSQALRCMGISKPWNEEQDDEVSCKSGKAVYNYTELKYLQDKGIEYAVSLLKSKKEYIQKVSSFLAHNELMDKEQYDRLEKSLKSHLKKISKDADNLLVWVWYESPAGRSFEENGLTIEGARIREIQNDPTILMSKGELNKHLKEEKKSRLDSKQKSCYDKINDIIDSATAIKEDLIIKSDATELERIVTDLVNRSVDKIRKIKDADNEEWSIIEKTIAAAKSDLSKIEERNSRISNYYRSEAFYQIKHTCNSLMQSQKEFNEYVEEKARSLTTLFGSRITRNETETEDTRNYIRPFKKTLDEFTAEVSDAVFASAENDPIVYVVKYFYPNKEKYPEQIQKLQTLIEELETLREAKEIIENYKKDYQQYLTEVPNYIMEQDRDGFYSRLGFADLNESRLNLMYKFIYTSNGGYAQKSFTVPLTEDTIIELIETLESKLTYAAFAKEQRNMMTAKLRQQIKERDNYTCKYCGNSTHKEPNLLLEVDHIVPVSKGGITKEDNLQTLCWKCNRSKSAKTI